MTLTELRDFIRLQLDEPNPAYWEDDDLDVYIKLAIQRFSRRVYPIIHKESFTISNTQNANTAVSEVVSITCVADLDAGTGTIGDQYFKLYDKDDTEYLVWYDVDDTGTAPPGDNLIEVDISANDTAGTVAIATSSAIAATTGFSAAVNSNIVTVTVDPGYIATNAVNFKVNNGTNDLTIAITTEGLDGYFALTYKMQNDKTATLIDADSDPVPLTRVAYGDWRRFSDDDRGKYKIYHVDEIHPDRVYFPISLDGGTVYLEYFAKPDASNISTILSDNLIFEEYHEALAKYALSLGLRRDKQQNESRDYLQQYMADEREAKIDLSEQRERAYQDDVSMSITNPHRNESVLFQNGITL